MHGMARARIFEGDKTSEAYDVRLPTDYRGETPAQMFIIDVPETEYIVFEHGSFDYEQESESVGGKLRAAIDGFDYSGTDYTPDNSTGRISYFCFDPEKYEKRIMPVKRKQK